MRVVRWIGIVFGVILGLLLVVGIAARFSDGPLGIMAGGPLVAGEMVGGDEPEWSFVRDVETVEFQLSEPPRSRTTWILENQGNSGSKRDLFRDPEEVDSILSCRELALALALLGLLGLLHLFVPKPRWNLCFAHRARPLIY